jgi:8'-apo-carotenoid 13,14-cleaving dioxygenase
MAMMRNADAAQTQASDTVGHARAADLLPVEGAWPAGLAGCLMIANPHPGCRAATGARSASSAPLTYSGITMAEGMAWWYRGKIAAQRDRHLGPRPDMAPLVWPAGAAADAPGPLAIARPIRDERDNVWHTIVTYPGLDHAEHQVAAQDGTVLRADPFPLAGAPLIQGLALTARYVVVLDLPVVYSRAAALIGLRFPYTWQPDRPVRIGLLPRHEGGASPRWFTIDPCYVQHVANAYEDGDRVVLDAVRHDQAFDPTRTDPDGPPQMYRWTLDLVTGTVHEGELTETLDTVTVDQRVRGQRHRYLYGTVSGPSGAALVCRDLATRRSQVHPLGAGMRVGPLVFVPRTPDHGIEGAGWLLALVENTREARSALLVLDALDLASPPQAVVHIPVAISQSGHATWLTTAQRTAEERAHS